MTYQLLVFLAFVMVFMPAFSHSEEVSQVSQYGITWKFEKPARVGKFVNNDWWVKGPVTVVSVTPAPGPAGKGEKTDVPKDEKNSWRVKDDNQMRNGSMVVLKNQGFDSRGLDYNSEMSIKFPYTLDVDTSLISTESHKSVPNNQLCYKIMWTSEQKVHNPLKTAAVLTCLKEAPPDDAFRPPYAGTKKTIYRAQDLKWGKLLNLKPVGNEPSWEDFERYFQRVWLDYYWNYEFCSVVPTENQPGYGREQARLVSMASLMLHLDVPKERKRNLLIGFVQHGIDLYGLSENGMNWRADGGIWSGRKWPIIFAGLMLDDENMQKLPLSVIFQEDQQTYYGKGWFGQTVLWQMVVHSGKRQPYEEKPPEKWDMQDKKSEAYRCCCNAVAWVGTALAVRMMKAVKIWGHDAFFDYCDRWMREDDPYRKARGKNERPSEEGKTFDPWVDKMWNVYRKKESVQGAAEKNMKWVWDGKEGKEKGEWVPNNK